LEIGVDKEHGRCFRAGRFFAFGAQTAALFAPTVGRVPQGGTAEEKREAAEEEEPARHSEASREKKANAVVLPLARKA
jgi:hypothetical protein